MKYKVWCDFNVEADSQHDVMDFICDEGTDFVENHIMVDEIPPDSDVDYRLDRDGNVEEVE